jgi:AraC-like DNA-binding protein
MMKSVEWSHDLSDSPAFIAWYPPLPLAQWVELLWYCADQKTGSTLREKVLPHGCVEFIINLSEHALTVSTDATDDQPSITGHLLISGPHTAPWVIGSGSRGASAGICLKPEGAYPLLGFPIDKLRNTHINLADVWPIADRELHAKLLETNDTHQRFHLMEQFLIECISLRYEVHPAVAYALRQCETHHGAVTIKALTKQTGLSTKRFIDLFRTQVGLTPKQFCRIERFQNILHTIHHEKHGPWADVALAYGYHDQSHFIRDFGALAGVTPTVYRNTYSTDVEDYLPL